jgi:hypothetical protein
MNYLQKIRRLYALSETATLGFTEAEIITLEKRLNIILPTALREYYLVLGKNQQINDNFNRLLKPAGEIDFSADRHLIFYEENQCVVYWGIKEMDLQQQNPPVYGNYDATNLSENWFADSPTTEDFLLSMAFWNGVLGGLNFNANTSSPNDLTPLTINRIAANFKEMEGLTNQYLRFFTNDFSAVIAVTTDEAASINGLYIGSSDRAAYDAIIDLLNINWNYRSDLESDQE